MTNFSEWIYKIYQNDRRSLYRRTKRVWKNLDCFSSCHSEIYLGDSAEPFHKRKFAELILNRVLEEETLRRTVKVIGAK